MKEVERKTIIIDGVETNYTIASNGEVFNTKTKRVLKGTYARNEYHSVQIMVNGKAKSLLTHKLIAQYFIPNPDNLPIVHHIDGDKHNNDISNLQWVTDSENSKHTFQHNEKTKSIDISDVEWKELTSFDNLIYYISINGALKKVALDKDGKIKNSRLLSGTKRNGYVRYSIKGKLYSAHRLVYEMFVGEIPVGMIIDHINGIRDDNRLENLRCITQSENANNAQKNGHKCQHQVEQYDINGNFIKLYPSFAEAAREMNVTSSAIASAAKRDGTSCGYKWKEI